jgi:hypothetical protein
MHMGLGCGGLPVRVIPMKSQKGKEQCNRGLTKCLVTLCFSLTRESSVYAT